MHQDLVAPLQQLGRPRMVVVGDLMLDHYVWGNVQRVSQEAPILVLSADHDAYRLGGAANVANLLAGYDVDVTPIGVVGDDRDGRQLCDLFEASGTTAQSIVLDRARRTTCKQRFIGRASGRHAGQILRVDREQTDAISRPIEQRIIDHIESTCQDADLLLISDYGKGACSAQVVQAAIASARVAKIPIYVDPMRGADLARYRGATLLKPNRYEASHAAGETIETQQQAMDAACRLAQCFAIDQVVVTLDRDGMVYAERAPRPEADQSLAPRAAAGHVPADVRDTDIYDITGAGDSALASLALARAAQCDLPAAVRLATVAAAWQVQREGVAVLTRSQLVQELTRHRAYPKVVPLAELTTTLAPRRQDQTVVFTNGCFDLLHVGHVTYLQEAAQCGDLLIVGLNSDESVARLKGPSRPVIPHGDRAAMLAALECVDYVVVFDDDTPCEILRQLRPDVLVKGGTYRREEVVGHDIVESYGGRVHLAQVVDGISTTHIVASLNARQDVPMRQAG